MKYRVRHTTRYSGSAPISVGHNEAWLTPRATPRQQCLQHKLVIDPEPSILSTRVDYFGNQVTQFSFNQGYQQLSVLAASQIELTLADQPPPEGAAWESIAGQLAEHATPADLDAYEFVFDSPRCRTRAEFAAYAQSSFPANRPLVSAATDLMHRLYADFRYDAAATNVTTPVEQVFRQRRGVCQDFAHLMISMLRSLGLSARYVSGYLRTSRKAGQADLVGHDASHAWLGVYCGSLGWIDFDPTNQQIPSADHITVAWGRDYTDVAPLKGVYIGGGTLNLTVEVEVVDESPA